MEDIIHHSIQIVKKIRAYFDNRSLILPFSLSRLTLFFVALIVISASFMRQMVDWLRNNLLGVRGIDVLILALIVGSIVFLATNLLTKRLSFFRLLLIAGIITVGFIGVMQLELAVEKVHILEYALLGWLALGDTTRTYPKMKAALIAMIFCALVGVVDEGFQGILPYRFYDNRDIIFNVLGALEGIVLYILYQ